MFRKDDVPAAPPAPIFHNVVPELKARTKTPILLPTRFPKNFQAHYAEIVANVSYFYMVELTTTPDCRAQVFCTDAVIDGFLRCNVNTPPLVGEKVRLKNGATAYWATSQCPYLGCRYNGLTFIYDGHVYVVAQVHGSLANALVLANSMNKVP